MFRLAFAITISVSAISAWGQAPNETATAPQIDKASAYYFYTVAHEYALKATHSRERNQEYIDRAIENYRAAIKADSEAFRAITELAEITRTGRLPLQFHLVLVIPKL
jgi:hypothetical protein